MRRAMYTVMACEINKNESGLDIIDTRILLRSNRRNKTKTHWERI